MTSEEIKAAIERLQALNVNRKCSNNDVLCALIGCEDWARPILNSGMLITLLRQADPGTHMELPRDADGEVIHIGDRMVTNHSRKIFVVTRLQYSEKHKWMIGGADKDDLSKYGLYAPCETRHYQPTVEDLLREMLEKAVGFSDAHTMVALNAIAEYAAKLREVIENERD